MGFTKTILNEGDGPKPSKGQTVTVHCVSWTRLLFADEIDDPFSHVVNYLPALLHRLDLERMVISRTLFGVQRMQDKNPLPFKLAWEK